MTRQIAFHTATDFRDNGRIHVMREDGSASREVTFGRNPEWSPDATRIAFEVWSGGLVGVVGSDGANRRTLHASRYGAFSPAWSPDGQRIAFDVGTYLDRDFGIWMMDLDGSGARQLTAALSGDWSPAWSPDGLEIASVSHSGISVTRLLDLNTRIVLARSARDVAWTADGRLTFTGYLRGGDSGPSRIFIEQAGEVRQVVADAISPIRADYSDWGAVWMK